MEVYSQAVDLVRQIKRLESILHNLKLLRDCSVVFSFSNIHVPIFFEDMEAPAMLSLRDQAIKSTQDKLDQLNHNLAML
jgi:hypothetical protein